MPEVFEATAGVAEARQSPADERGLHSVRLPRHAEIIVANSEVQGERWKNLPVVLDEHAEFFFVKLALLVVTVRIEIAQILVCLVAVVQDEGLRDGVDRTRQCKQQVFRGGHAASDEAWNIGGLHLLHGEGASAASYVWKAIERVQAFRTGDADLHTALVGMLALCPTEGIAERQQRSRIAVRIRCAAGRGYDVRPEAERRPNQWIAGGAGGEPLQDFVLLFRVIPRVVADRIGTT